jgi:thioesterase domain-containing protein
MPNHRQPFVPPRDQLEVRLIQLWEQVLGVEHIGIKDNFFALGGDATLAQRLLAVIEQSLEKKFFPEALFAYPTVELMARRIEEGLKPLDWFSVVTIRKVGSKAPLFVIHWLGDGVLYGLRLKELLGPNQPIYGLCCAFAAGGWDMRNQEIPTFQELAAHYIREMRQVQPEGPYHIIGFCLGGQIAWEMARQLSADQQEVGCLAMVDATPPENIAVLSFPQQVSTVWEELFRLGPVWTLRRIVRKISEGLVEFCRESQVQILPRIVDKIKGKFLRTVPVSVNGYHTPEYPGRVLLFRVMPRDPGLRSKLIDEDTLGWGKFSTGKLEVHDIITQHTQWTQGRAGETVSKILEVNIGEMREGRVEAQR